MITLGNSALQVARSFVAEETSFYVIVIAHSLSIFRVLPFSER